MFLLASRYLIRLRFCDEEQFFISSFDARICFADCVDRRAAGQHFATPSFYLHFFNYGKTDHHFDCLFYKSGCICILQCAHSSMLWKRLLVGKVFIPFF